MIDLISNGLALRKQITISLEDPQEIRSMSARSISSLVRDSAESSESADRYNKNQDHSYCNKFKITSAAEVADLAETQSRQSTVIADDLRKNCGVSPAVNLALNSNPTNPLEMVTCNDCEHFNSDTIGDGFGIGDCGLGVKWTQEFDGRRPLYRYADRHCGKFSKLMS